MIFYNYYKSFYSTDASSHTHCCVHKCSPFEQLIRRWRTGRRGGLRLHFIREKRNHNNFIHRVRSHISQLYDYIHV